MLSKYGEYGKTNFEIFVNDEVLVFNIAVGDSVLLEVLDSVGDLREDVSSLRL